jgi:hypothetical protein
MPLFPEGVWPTCSNTLGPSIYSSDRTAETPSHCTYDGLRLDVSSARKSIPGMTWSGRVRHRTKRLRILRISGKEKASRPTCILVLPGKAVSSLKSRPRPSRRLLLNRPQPLCQLATIRQPQADPPPQRLPQNLLPQNPHLLHRLRLPSRPVNRLRLPLRHPPSLDRLIQQLLPSWTRALNIT